MLPKRGRRVRQDRSVTRHATQMLSHSASPIPDKPCAKQCCTSTFASCSSPQMSSCGYWKTPRADVQTTTRGHRDRTGGNGVRPMKRLAAASADAVLVPSGMPRTCQRRKHRRSADPIRQQDYPIQDLESGLFRASCGATRNTRLRRRRSSPGPEDPCRTARRLACWPP